MVGVDQAKRPIHTNLLSSAISSKSLESVNIMDFGVDQEQRPLHESMFQDTSSKSTITSILVDEDDFINRDNSHVERPSHTCSFENNCPIPVLTKLVSCSSSLSNLSSLVDSTGFLGWDNKHCLDDGSQDSAPGHASGDTNLNAKQHTRTSNASWHIEDYKDTNDTLKTRTPSISRLTLSNQLRRLSLAAQTRHGPQRPQSGTAVATCGLLRETSTVAPREAVRTAELKQILLTRRTSSSKDLKRQPGKQRRPNVPTDDYTARSCGSDLSNLSSLVDSTGFLGWGSRDYLEDASQDSALGQASGGTKLDAKKNAPMTDESWHMDDDSHDLTPVCVDSAANLGTGKNAPISDASWHIEDYEDANDAIEARTSSGPEHTLSNRIRRLSLAATDMSAAAARGLTKQANTDAPREAVCTADLKQFLLARRVSSDVGDRERPTGLRRLSASFNDCPERRPSSLLTLFGKKVDEHASRRSISRSINCGDDVDIGELRRKLEIGEAVGAVGKSQRKAYLSFRGLSM